MGVFQLMVSILKSQLSTFYFYLFFFLHLAMKGNSSRCVNARKSDQKVKNLKQKTLMEIFSYVHMNTF